MTWIDWILFILLFGLFIQLYRSRMNRSKQQSDQTAPHNIGARQYIRELYTSYQDADFDAADRSIARLIHLGERGRQFIFNEWIIHANQLDEISRSEDWEGSKDQRRLQILLSQIQTLTWTLQELGSVNFLESIRLWSTCTPLQRALIIRALNGCDIEWQVLVAPLSKTVLHWTFALPLYCPRKIKQQLTLSMNTSLDTSKGIPLWTLELLGTHHSYQEILSFAQVSRINAHSRVEEWALLRLASIDRLDYGTGDLSKRDTFYWLSDMLTHAQSGGVIKEAISDQELSKWKSILNLRLIECNHSTLTEDTRQALHHWPSLMMLETCADIAEQLRLDQTFDPLWRLRLLHVFCPNDPRTVERLYQCLKSTHQELRSEALILLLNRGDQSLASPLIEQFITGISDSLITRGRLLNALKHAPSNLWNSIIHRLSARLSQGISIRPFISLIQSVPLHNPSITQRCSRAFFQILARSSHHHEQLLIARYLDQLNPSVPEISSSIQMISGYLIYCELCGYAPDIDWLLKLGRDRPKLHHRIFILFCMHPYPIEAFEREVEKGGDERWVSMIERMKITQEVLTIKS